MIDIIKLQRIIVKAFADYGLTSSKLDKETVGAYLAVDIYRAELEPIPAPKKQQKLAQDNPEAVKNHGQGNGAR